MILMNFQPTEEQLQAMHCVNNHAAVTAGAGAGKTKVLIYRILNIVLSGAADFSQIAAITFTEKAASEMKVKLRREAKEQIAKNPLLRDKLSQVSLTHISTIHSFCSSIIRRFALDLGLTPDFQILLQDESTRILKNSIAEVLESLENQSGLAEDSKANRTVNDFLVRFKANNYRLSDDLLNTYNKIRELGFTLEEAFSLTDERFGNSLIIAKQALDNYITTLDRCYEMKNELNGVQKRAKFVKIVLENWQEYRKHFINLQTITDYSVCNMSDDEKKVIEFLGFLNERDTINPIFGLDTDTIVKDGIRSIPFLFTYKDVEKLLVGFKKILKEVHQNYSQQKVEAHTLDFIDLQQKALEVLQNPKAKIELLSEFKYLMIDEYQDTNYLQQRIVDEIWNEENELNLFIVGDPKQSIYGFRGAEVSLFNETSERIKNRDGKQIHMKHNFRSEKKLIEFYNSFFSGYMQGDKEKNYAIKYEDVLTEKTTDNDCFHIVACYYDPKEEEKLDPKRWQAKALTKIIYEAVNCGKNAEEKANYGDFAVLFHKRSAGLAELEEELSKAGIPFVSGMGDDYFAREEVRDCLSLIYFLNNPLDDISLAATLKGPFFNYSDLDLYRLFQAKKDYQTSLYGAILLLGGQSKLVTREKEALLLENAIDDQEIELAEELAYLRTLFGYKNVADILRDLIEKSSFQLVLRAQPMGLERIANLEKLLYIIEEEVNRGLSNNEIVEYLKVLEEYRDADAEVVSESEDRVRLMTIHASKGLEFERVILAGLNISTRSLNEPLMNFDKEQGLIIGIANYSSTGQRVSCSDPRYFLSKRRVIDEEEYEKQRLFYVAATRAMKKLYLTFSGKFLTQSGTSQNPIIKMFDWDLDGECVKFQEYKANFYPYDFVNDFEVDNKPVIPDGRVDDVFLKTRYRALSPTALSQFDICPRLFYLEQRLKAPSLQDIFLEKELEEFELITQEYENEMLFNRTLESQIDGKDIGTILHRIFATAKDIAEAEKIFAENKINEIYRPILVNYFNSEYGSSKGLSEVPVSLYLPEKNLRIIGVLDRVIFNKDNIKVVDFKTYINLKDYQNKAKDFELQLAVYAIALRERYKLPVRAFIYFPFPDISCEIDLNKAEKKLFLAIDKINQVLDAKEIPVIKSTCNKNCRYLTLCNNKSIEITEE